MHSGSSNIHRKRGDAALVRSVYKDPSITKGAQAICDGHHRERDFTRRYFPAICQHQAAATEHRTK